MLGEYPLNQPPKHYDTWNGNCGIYGCGEIAAARDLESRVERRVGANPIDRTIYYYVAP